MYMIVQDQSNLTQLNTKSESFKILRRITSILFTTYFNFFSKWENISTQFC